MNRLADVGALPVVREARVAGFCYLLVILGGIFAAVFVRESLFVPTDPAATARAITANETLWRWGVAIHALYLLPAAAFGAILYRLFRSVQPTIALVAFVLAIAPVAIEAVLLTSLTVPLTVLEESRTIPFPAQQRQALAHLSVRLFLIGWGFSLLLFSGFCVLFGYLILRSRLVPRVIGALMIMGGAGYFVNSVAGIVSPPLQAALTPWVLLLPFVGESSLALWLLVQGVSIDSTNIVPAPPASAGPMSNREDGNTVYREDG